MNRSANGVPINFARISRGASGQAVVTPWSSIQGMSEEIKLATVKSSQGGFNPGDLFFGTGEAGEVGWFSADSSSSMIPWKVLPDEVNHLRGSLCFDETGVWNHELVVVTGNEGDDEYTGEKGIWRITPTGSATKITTIHTYHLEGAVTIPNEFSTWGPWAGKLLTGDEWGLELPLVFAVGTEGAVDRFPLGIQPEDFDVIPPGQDLYLCAFYQASIVKVPKSFLAPFVGQLLVTQAGEIPFSTPRLYIVSWDGQDFLHRSVAYPDHGWEDDALEHSTFGPIELEEIE